ncbi:MAG: hypothetical protein MK165_19940 [Pirellulaceae bacterium]|nr:hypothetical protein [Pirellulaceae bacterium]
MTFPPPLGCKWTGSEILPRVWRFGWIGSPAIAVFAVIFATPTAADDTRYLDALRGLDQAAEVAFAPHNEKRTGHLLRHKDELIAAYPNGEGDIVTRRHRVAGKWSLTTNVTEAALRREGEVWDMPRLVAGPDGNPWLVYRSEVRRRLFFHRWLGEQWGPRLDGPAIHDVNPQITGEFEEELRPIREYIVEGSRVQDAILVRLVSEDEPSLETVATIPMIPLTANPTARFLFIDDRHVASVQGAVWTPHASRRHASNPVLTQNPNPEAADTVRIFNRGSVRIEDGRFRMWYTATETGMPGGVDRAGPNWQSLMHVCYAESTDGIHWQRPELGLVEFRGSKRNNIVPELLRIPTVFYDDLEPDPDRRYKSWEIASASRSSQPESGDLMTSADGIHWRKSPAPRSYPGVRPWFVEYHNVFRDDREDDPQRRWKAYGSFGTGPRWRTCHLSTSPDGVYWTGYLENPVIDPLRGAGHCIHDLIVWQEADCYVGLVQVGDEYHNYEWELVVSRDGVHFSYVVDGLKFISRAPPGHWDHGGLQASRPVRVGDKWWFYYGAYESPWTTYPQDESAIFKTRMSCGIARLDVGRYAGFRTSDDAQDGMLTTRPISVSFDRKLALTLNAFIPEGYRVRVAVLDAQSNHPLAGFSLHDCIATTRDGVSTAIHWKNHALVWLRKSKSIRLKFELSGTDCELFGFGWEATH